MVLVILLMKLKISTNWPTLTNPAGCFKPPGLAPAPENGSAGSLAKDHRSRLMRRIGIVCGAGIVSGKEIMALQLGEGMKSRGYALDFVTSSWGSADFSKRLRELSIAAHVVRIGFISATLTLNCLRMTAHQA